MPRILVTGFKPFLGQSVNPSEKLSQDLQNNFKNVHSLVLPVEFGQAFLILEEHLRNHIYDYVIMLGQAAGRSTICLEKIALNWIETSHNDEAGFRPNRSEIIAQAPLALMTRFPINEIYEKLKSENLPVTVSFSAGTFVCNELYFRVLNQYSGLRSLFVHVPQWPEQNPEIKELSMHDEEQMKVLTRLIEVLEVSN